MATISFDIGGVLDEASETFLPILQKLALFKHRVIVVTAIGYGKPEKWGFSESARHATSAARLFKKGYVQGEHWHELFVVPDPDSGLLTGKYKNFVLQNEQAILHVDDNRKVMDGITACRMVQYTVGAVDNMTFERLFYGELAGMIGMASCPRWS